MGHTQDSCYSIYGFLEKSANTSKSETSEMKFSEADYQEYLQLKAAKESPSSFALVAHNSTACISQSGHDQSPWIIDSGAFDHIAGNGSLFSSISSNKNPHFITLADGSKLAARVSVMCHPLLLCLVYTWLPFQFDFTRSTYLFS